MNQLTEDTIELEEHTPEVFIVGVHGGFCKIMVEEKEDERLRDFK